MRCPDCSKFVGLELQEPEENSAEFDAVTGEIEAEYRVVRCCADCGQELKEATISFSEQFDPETLEVHQGDGHELKADFAAENIEEGGGRYAKSYYGVSLSINITCTCGEVDETIDLADKVAASEMDELA